MNKHHLPIRGFKSAYSMPGMSWNLFGVDSINNSKVCCCSGQWNGLSEFVCSDKTRGNSSQRFVIAVMGCWAVLSWEQLRICNLSSSQGWGVLFFLFVCFCFVNPHHQHLHPRHALSSSDYSCKQGGMQRAFLSSIISIVAIVKIFEEWCSWRKRLNSCINTKY